MEKYTEEIRKFNRFYTRVIGVNNQYTDQSKYSATEAQILYEISIKHHCSAGYLSDYFYLDKGYLSRIIKRFEKDEIIRKRPSPEDRRVAYIEITEKGRKELSKLISSANDVVSKMIAHVPDEKKQSLIKAMEKIQAILIDY